MAIDAMEITPKANPKYLPLSGTAHLDLSGFPTAKNKRS
jgi:hypothetical protein